MSVRFRALTLSFLDRGSGSRNESRLHSCAGRRFADEPTDRTPHRKIGGQSDGDHVHRKQFVFVLQDESRRFQAWFQHSLYAGLQSHDHREKRNGSVAVLRPQRLSQQSGMFVQNQKSGQRAALPEIRQFQRAQDWLRAGKFNYVTNATKPGSSHTFVLLTFTFPREIDRYTTAPIRTVYACIPEAVSPLTLDLRSRSLRRAEKCSSGSLPTLCTAMPDGKPSFPLVSHIIFLNII